MPVVTVVVMPAVMQVVEEVVEANSPVAVAREVWVEVDGVAMDVEAMGLEVTLPEEAWVEVDAVTAAQVTAVQAEVEMADRVTAMAIVPVVATTVVATTVVATTVVAIPAGALVVRVAWVATIPVGSRQKHAHGLPQTLNPLALTQHFLVNSKSTACWSLSMPVL
jgi:hypothetical protein